MRKTVLPALVGAVLSLAIGGAAEAQNARTWISGAGLDQSGCGPIASPCRTLQYAHNVTNAGGEIDVKDSAGYGAVTITKSIAIVGDGSLAGVLATSGANAITINAGPSDSIVLRGLTIEGANVGTNGIVFNSGKALDIASCTIQNFAGFLTTGNGILLQPSSGTVSVSIADTTAAHNASVGFFYLSPASGTASVTMQATRFNTSQNGSTGFVSNTQQATGGTTKITITDSVSSNNVGDGYFFNKAGTFVVDLTTASGNGATGFAAQSNAFLTIGRSVAASNVGVGLYATGGVVYSFSDNRFVGNSAPTAGTVTPIAPQ